MTYTIIMSVAFDNTLPRLFERQIAVAASTHVKAVASKCRRKFIKTEYLRVMVAPCRLLPETGKPGI